MSGWRALLAGPSDKGRSPHWPAFRRGWLAANPACAVASCRRLRWLLRRNDVHHVVPFHENPALELDQDNLLTLCRPHHFRVGHLGNWRASNPDVRRDAASS